MYYFIETQKPNKSTKQRFGKRSDWDPNVAETEGEIEKDPELANIEGRATVSNTADTVLFLYRTGNKNKRLFLKPIKVFLIRKNLKIKRENQI